MECNFIYFFFGRLCDAVHFSNDLTFFLWKGMPWRQVMEIFRK